MEGGGGVGSGKKVLGKQDPMARRDSLDLRSQREGGISICLLISSFLPLQIFGMANFSYISILIPPRHLLKK